MDNLSTGYSALNLPFSPEAEQSVLGAILLDSSCLDRVAEILPRPDYFYQTNNGLIYGAMLDMFTLGKPVDFVTVLEKLKESREFDEASGKTYLLQLAQIVPSISNVESYARIVRDKYDIRTLITTAREIMEEAADGTADAATLLDSAEQRIFDIRRGKNMQGLQRIDEIIIQTLDRLDLLNSPDSDQYKGVPTGIKELDDTITGLNRSDLILLAARPGMGKTSFALNIARHAAVKADKRVAFFSLEMTKEQLVSRLLSTEALVGGTKLRTGKLTEEEWVRLIEGGDILNINDKVLAIGISQRTEPDAIDAIAKNIFNDPTSPIETILAFNIPNSRAFMHLDTVFTQIDVDKFTIHPGIMGPLTVFEITAAGEGIKVKEVNGTLESILETYVGHPVELIPCGGGDRIAAEREQWNDGSNTLCIAPGKIVVYERNDVTNKVLRDKGLDLIIVPSAELSRGRGGPRCMSMPLIRAE